MNQWAFFFAERFPSPDFKGIAAPERTKLIAGEWKALDASEKKVCRSHVCLHTETES